VTGSSGEVIDDYAERIFNLQRAILLREGRKVPEADYPLELNFKEPLKADSPYSRALLVPGPGDGAVDTTGFILDKNKYTQMLKEYYRLRGWDETGNPEKETLIAQGLEDVAAQLYHSG
jgi:aldehyde:ferredoxin oxidoreductase